MNHLRGPTSAMFFDNWQLGLTTSQAEMDPWQSGAWDVRINYVIKFTAEMPFTKAHF